MGFACLWKHCANPFNCGLPLNYGKANLGVHKSVEWDYGGETIFTNSSSSQQDN